MEKRKRTGTTAAAWIVAAAVMVFLLVLAGEHVRRSGLFYAPVAPIVEIETDGLVPEKGGQLLDLNLASEDELRQLPGIGEELARRIVRWRREHGGFDRAEQLGEVEGIGAARLEALLSYVTVSDALPGVGQGN